MDISHIMISCVAESCVKHKESPFKIQANYKSNCQVCPSHKSLFVLNAMNLVKIQI